MNVIHNILTNNQTTISCAESLTSGLLQHSLTKMSGASKYFAGGVTAYSIAMKAKLLGVDEEMATKCNAVSSEVATSMAKGCLSLFGTDIALATTGYAEPYTNEQGVTFEQEAFISLSTSVSSFTQRISAEEMTGKSRSEVQEMVVEQCLLLLQKHLVAREMAKLS